MAKGVNSFVEELISITPANFAVNPYGSVLRMPKVGSRGVPGTGEASTDVIQALRRDAINFAEAYSDPNSREEDIRKIANDIEGNIMVQATLSVLTEEKANHLINELQDLISEKYKKVS